MDKKNIKNYKIYQMSFLNFKMLNCTEVKCAGKLLCFSSLTHTNMNKCKGLWFLDLILLKAGPTSLRNP